MFSFVGAPVPVRDDLRFIYTATWSHFARPGATLTGEQRLRLLAAVRNGTAESDAPSLGLSVEAGQLAGLLYRDPISVNGATVRAAIDTEDDPLVVEVIAIVSMLASIDGTHRALGAELEPLPEPQVGEPTGHIASGLKPRRTHIPVPPGAINVMFDLLPMEGAVFQTLFGPQYMTGWEMALDTFARSPGLNRAQMELVSSRTSLHNECFY